MPGQHLALQPLPLPRRIVRILDRKVRQPRDPVRVSCRQFSPEHPNRPTVGHNVVHGYHQQVCLFRHLHHQYTQQWASLQAEGLGRLYLRQPQRLPPAFSGLVPLSQKIYDPQRRSGRFLDHLHRLPTLCAKVRP